MSAYYLADHALRVWPAMFLPVLVGFCYIPLFCDEQESGALRHEIIRTKPVLFWASRYILASVVGGVIILSGFLLYVIFVYIFFPILAAYESNPQLAANLPFILEGFQASDEPILILHLLGVSFVYGFLGGVVSILLTCFSTNKYIILCIPFFIKYILSQTAMKMMLSDTVNPDVAIKWNIDSILAIQSLKMYAKGILIFLVNIFLIGLFLYTFLRMRRFDHGE